MLTARTYPVGAGTSIVTSPKAASLKDITGASSRATLAATCSRSKSVRFGYGMDEETISERLNLACCGSRPQ